MPPSRSLKILVTAGPTHEPLDSVRYLANRSSGRVGVALADAAAQRGHQVRLLLGPTQVVAVDPQVTTSRFRSTADLQALLEAHFDHCDLLVMVAAIADYRPKNKQNGKIKRSEHDALVLELEPTPDLLRGCADRRRPGQTLVGFALEPHERLMDSARAKLARKKIDAIVANPLETMDSDQIDAKLLTRPASDAAEASVAATTGGPVSKPEFAAWLVQQLEPIALRNLA